MLFGRFHLREKFKELQSTDRQAETERQNERVIERERWEWDYPDCKEIW